ECPVKITIGEPAPTTAVARKIPYGRIPAALVERSIPAAFEEIAQSFPDRIAVRSEEENVTYGELDARADSVAHQLLMARGGNPRRSESRQDRRVAGFPGPGAPTADDHRRFRFRIDCRGRVPCVGLWVF